MSLEVALVDERGKHLAQISDVQDLVDRARSAAGVDSRMLGFIDPYGDTTLNALQIPEFLDDWDNAQRLVASSQDRQAWAEVAALARRCSAEPHTYLRFIGD